MNFPQKPTNPLQGAYCGLVGHRYRVSQRITHHINEYECCNCGKQITDTFSGKTELLTVKNKQVNEKLAEFFRKKQAYFQRKSQRIRFAS
ncbi:hypothetical protein MG296_03830 [Flavobacteriaceae bacterium TK19130]|nr:hypothetical protein [Thermobacterium salinum]